MQNKTGGYHFSLKSINYPTIRDIYRDTDLPNFKVKSYYLHNKLLWTDAGIKETNETVISLKNDFAELQRKNVYTYYFNETKPNTKSRTAKSRIRRQP